MMRRMIPLTLFALLVGFFYVLPARSQSNDNVPSIEILKQLYPARQWTPSEQQKFRYWRVDFNGDGRKEWLVVENPNKKKKAKVAAKPKGCPCPAKRLKGKARRLKRLLRWDKRSIDDVKLVKIRRYRYHLKVWFSLKKISRKRKSFDRQMLRWCRRLGQRYRRVRRYYKIRRFILINKDDGETASISIYRCRRLARMSYRRRRYRFRRWKKKLARTSIKLCPCPKKKKKKIAAYRPPKPLKILVAKEILPKKQAATPATTGLSDQPQTPKLAIVGRFLGDNIQLSPLTTDNKIIALRIQRQQQGGIYTPRSTYENFYIYDEGNSGRMKQILRLEVARENLDNEPDARQWIQVTLRNMDSDHWKEIIADHYFENPFYNGRVSRKMYKWYEGRYVDLNKARGIFRAIASSTWRRIAPKAGRKTRRRLSAKTMPLNVIDGFRDTIWTGARARRGIGDWVRVEFMHSKKLFGVAISTIKPKKILHVVPNLFPSGLVAAPRLIAPKYVRISTSTSLDMTVALDETRPFNLIMFPRVVWTRFLQVTLVDRWRDPSKRTHQLKIPKKERSLGFIAEIMPLEDKNHYTASSFEFKSAESFLPRYAGDGRTNTAWAEGRKDAGIGEWIQLILPKPKLVRKLRIINGCTRPGESYTLNNRIKEAELEFSDGTKQTILLKGHHKPQLIKIAPKRTLAIKLTIRSIYKGKLGHTTCLAEFQTR